LASIDDIWPWATNRDFNEVGDGGGERKGEREAEPAIVEVPNVTGEYEVNNRDNERGAKP